MEQGEEVENNLTQVASQAQESPSSNPTEESAQSQENQENQGEIVAEAQQAVPSTNSSSNHPVRRRVPKATGVPAQKLSIKKEEESVEQDVSGFQDDPSDSDYTPSRST